MAKEIVEVAKILIVDALTGDSVERPLNAQEIANKKVIEADFAAIKSEQDARSDARTSALAKLAALGLSAEEIAAL